MLRLVAMCARFWWAAGLTRHEHGVLDPYVPAIRELAPDAEIVAVGIPVLPPEPPRIAVTRESGVERIRRGIRRRFG